MTSTVLASIGTSLVGGDDLWYELVFFLHIAFAIVGFGTVFLNGLYGVRAAQRPADEELAISETVVGVSKVAEYFIYGVFVTGLILGIAADEPVGLGDLWLSLSMLLFIASVGVSHGLLNPSVRAYNTALAEAASSGAERPTPDMEAAGKKTAMAGAFLDLSVLVILYLMIFKPGLI